MKKKPRQYQVIHKGKVFEGSINKSTYYRSGKTKGTYLIFKNGKYVRSATKVELDKMIAAGSHLKSVWDKPSKSKK